MFGRSGGGESKCRIQNKDVLLSFFLFFFFEFKCLYILWSLVSFYLEVMLSWKIETENILNKKKKKKNFCRFLNFFYLIYKWITKFKWKITINFHVILKILKYREINRTLPWKFQLTKYLWSRSFDISKWRVQNTKQGRAFVFFSLEFKCLYILWSLVSFYLEVMLSWKIETTMKVPAHQIFLEELH
jgi:hypothetical protein